MNTYFISIDGDVVTENLSKEKAVEKAKKIYDKGITFVMVGHIKMKQGKRVFNVLPLHYYIN